MADFQKSRLYLLTPPVAESELDAFAALLGEALSAADVACVLARVAPQSAAAAKTIIARLAGLAAETEAALLVDGDPRLALDADGAHIHGAGDALSEAIASLKPDRIVGAGLLRSRDDAMRAGEVGADYVMFGEPRADGYTPPSAETVERVAWWAEIFEQPCVGFASRLGDIPPLAAAGADFIALGDAIWQANKPAEALAQAEAALIAPRAA
ncbi:MAG TPA: thiamine phosphate synthase [Roseiarcus sp.]|nr:thiamine phosphate synthase [Roseiarcus sp.]